ncbi:MAG TPA: energy-coupling factor transporter ATPase [Thermoanaerobacterales bacterium]|nr:energy-coupling factor transporter ATPase [Thermoanaerobacterales bacterium]
MADAIELVNVQKQYKVNNHLTHALKDVNLTIPKGQFIGILGENGSGKTTLARLFNGLILPTKGNVYVDGMDTFDKRFIKKIRSRVGMIFQNPENQIISSIVEEELAFGPQNLNLPIEEIDKRVDKALNIMGLTALRFHATNLLSGGQKQRLAIASILTMKPQYLILDEPTSMLDQSGRYELINYLKKLNKQHNITIVLITHNIKDILSADRLIVLKKGAVVLDSTPWKIFSSPENLEISGLNPPDMVKLVNGLNKRGYKLKDEILTTEQMVEFICRQLN